MNKQNMLNILIFLIITAMAFITLTFLMELDRPTGEIMRTYIEIITKTSKKSDNRQLLWIFSLMLHIAGAILIAGFVCWFRSNQPLKKK